MSAVEVSLLAVIGLVFAVSLLVKLFGRWKRIDLLVAGSATALFGVLWVVRATSVTKPADEVFRLDTLVIALWVLSAAYLVNVTVRTVVYPLRVTSDGDPMIPLLLQRLIAGVIYLVALVVILQFLLGQSVTAIATTSGALALIIGFSSRNILEEFFAGLALYADEPFSKGDLIQIDDAWAIVKDITWRSLTYLDMDENLVVIPNSRVAAASIRNLDRPTKLVRRTMNIQVEYNVPPQVVIAECEGAMEDTPLILDHPWNYVAFFEADESGIKYRMAFYVAHYNDWFTASDELLNAIWYRFARKKIRFAHQRKLNYIDREDEQRGLHGSAYDEANWHDLVAKFRTDPIFEGMTIGDMEYLAQRASLRVLGPPERIMTAGSQTTSLFLVASGVADVYGVDEQNNEIWVSTVEEASTVGLMSLLTGSAPRTTVRARTEVAVWEIDSESLHLLFERNPDVMNNIANNVARWQADEEETLNTIASNRRAESQNLAKNHDALRKRIVSFFDRRGDLDAKPQSEPKRDRERSLP